MGDPIPNTPAESNGHLPPAPDPVRALEREVVLLRARCSNLRHWCDTLINDPAAAGVLDEATVANLRDTAPEVTEAEGQTVVALLARGGCVPPTHPLATATANPNQLRAAVAALTAEHERLRQAFFALYNHLHPDDDLTDEYFLAQQWDDSVSLSDLIAELEREAEAKS